MKLPLVPVSDGAGDVVECGPGAMKLHKDDRVAAIFTQCWLSGPPIAGMYSTSLGGGIDGMLAEYVVLREDGFVRIPDYMTYEEAATLPCAAVTSWNALVTEGRLEARRFGAGDGDRRGLDFCAPVRRHVRRARDRNFEQRRQAEPAQGDGRVGPDQLQRPRRTGTSACSKSPAASGVDHVVEIGGAGTLPKSINAVKTGRYRQPHRDSHRRGPDRSDAAAVQECAPSGNPGRLRARCSRR